MQSIKVKLIGTITFLLFVVGTFSIATAETLKKNATVCRTKAQFNEIVRNRQDSAYVMKMLIDGKCVMNLGGTEIPVEVLEGIVPMVKIKMIWNDEIFIGWTDAIFIRS